MRSIVNILLISLFCSAGVKSSYAQFSKSMLEGGWGSDKGVIIFAGPYFSYAFFSEDEKEFRGTYGGSWEIKGGSLLQTIEYNTLDPEKVGETVSDLFTVYDNRMEIGNDEFIRIDDGSPGKLNGAWLFLGRIQDGDTTRRDTNQPRKTMKILSGMRFQWIAFNTETGQFFGTGGGTYTTIGNNYTENIEFFSRDSSRVGASLSFDYALLNGIWHHKGLNSRGEPLYELWEKRE